MFMCSSWVSYLKWKFFHTSKIHNHWVWNDCSRFSRYFHPPNCGLACRGRHVDCSRSPFLWQNLLQTKQSNWTGRPLQSNRTTSELLAEVLIDWCRKERNVYRKTSLSFTSSASKPCITYFVIANRKKFANISK